MGGRVGPAEYILEGLDDDERLRKYYDAAAVLRILQCAPV